MDERGHDDKDDLRTLIDPVERGNAAHPPSSEPGDGLFIALQRLNSHFVNGDPVSEASLHGGETVPADQDGFGTDQESRREQILTAASELFAERGYHGSSLRMIARASSISHPGMLHHFASKAALLDGVIDLLEAHAQALLDTTEQLGASLPALRAALAGPWDPKQRPMSLLATLTSEIVDPEHPGRYRLARLRLVHEHILEAALASHVEQGRLVAETDPQFVARTVMSLLLSLAVREHSVRELQHSDDAEPVTEILSFVAGYLAHSPGGAETGPSGGAE